MSGTPSSPPNKRVATLNRTETAAGRAAAEPEGLEALAPCTLNQ